MRRLLIVGSFLLITTCILSQVTLEGYVFEEKNRGYISGADVAIFVAGTEKLIGTALTDEMGKYQIELPSLGVYDIQISKESVFAHVESLDVHQTDKIYIKHALTRLPGYTFEITLSEKNVDSLAYSDAIKGALIEVYNNTERREAMILEDYAYPEFKLHLRKGNHYTILIRKAGYAAKRLEAYIDVAGCILCFEGLGNTRPGVSDNLSNDNEMGVLLANIELDQIYQGKKIGLNHIYYELNSAELTQESKRQLQSVAELLKDNPGLKLELGSHTDARGADDYNLKLSQKRAKNAVDHLVKMARVSSDVLVARGYGETELVNNCKNNISCSEEQHAQNRRTELKIIDIYFPDNWRYLRQIKAEEFMDELLVSIREQGQIRVQDGGSVDNALSIANTQESLNRTPKSAITADPQAIVEKPIRPKAENLKEGEKRNTDIKAIPKEPTIEIKNKGTNDSQRNNARSPLPNDKSVETEKSIKPLQNIEFHQRNAALKGFSGYKIVLRFSRFALPPTDPIHQYDKELIVYTTADNNLLYMIGEYKGLEDASEGLERKYQAQFPNAYVVGFKEGIRVY